MKRAPSGVRAMILAMMAGCGFAPAASTDARPIDAHDASLGGLEKVDTPPMHDAPCFTTVTDGLVVCLELDDPGLTTAKDGSGLHHDALIAATNVATRDVPMASQAAQIISTSVIDIPESPDLDFQSLTITAWVRPEAFQVAGQQYALVHNRGQYYMSINDQGDVFCAIENSLTAYTEYGDLMPLNTWSLAGCTYDGVNVCAFTFAAGAAAGTAYCTYAGVPVNTTFTSGLSIGSFASSTGGHSNHLAGKLDSVRIYSRPLSKAEICTSAGISGC